MSTTKKPSKTSNKFVVVKKYKLDQLGEGWEDCFLKFKSVSYNESLELRKEYDLEYTREEILADPKLQDKASSNALRLLGDYYIEGQGFDGEKVVPIAKDEIGNLPVDILVNAFLFLTGNQGVTDLKG